MKPSEIRAMSAQERADKLQQLYKKEAAIRLNLNQDNFNHTHKMSQVKKMIARMKTIETEMKLNEGVSA